MKKYPSIPQILEEDYHFIKCDILLVSVYSTGNVAVLGMLITDAFITDEIRATGDYREYETVFKPSTTSIPPLSDDQERDDIAEATLLREVGGEEESYASDFADSVFNDDEDDFSTRIEPGSHKENPENVDDDDENDKEKKYEKKDDDGKKDDYKDKDNDDHTDHTLAPRIIKELFKSYVSNNVIQVHPTTSTSTATTSSVVLQQQLYLKMKSNLKDQATDPELWDVVKRMFEKSSTSTTSCRDDSARGCSSKQLASTYVSKYQQQQQDWDAWIKPQVIYEDEVIPEDTTPELIDEFQNVDKHILTIYDYARMMATLNDVMSNQFEDTKEYAYHLEQTKNYMENQIV
ncbi:hypothetical protein Tco_1027024 [Tanacetum coccineum]